MPGRMPKVNELLRQELSQMVHKKLGPVEGIVTVTDVETTSDLREAVVHVSVFGDDGKIIRDELQAKAPDFHKELAKRLRLKFIPKLTFAINDENRRERVEKLLDELS